MFQQRLKVRKTLDATDDDDAPTGLNTIQGVARLAGVSTATVSRVANDTSSVSGEIRTKVMTVI
jgi:hypothetical protein